MWRGCGAPAVPFCGALLAEVEYLLPPCVARRQPLHLGALPRKLGAQGNSAPHPTHARRGIVPRGAGRRWRAVVRCDLETVRRRSSSGPSRRLGKAPTVFGWFFGHVIDFFLLKPAHHGRNDSASDLSSSPPLRGGRRENSGCCSHPVCLHHCLSSVRRVLTNSVHQFSLLDLSMLRAPAEACARNEKFEKQLELAGAFPRVPALCVQRVGETMCQRLAMRGWPCGIAKKVPVPAPFCNTMGAALAPFCNTMGAAHHGWDAMRCAWSRGGNGVRQAAFPASPTRTPHVDTGPRIAALMATLHGEAGPSMSSMVSQLKATIAKNC